MDNIFHQVYNFYYQTHGHDKSIHVETTYTLIQDNGSQEGDQRQFFNENMFLNSLKQPFCYCDPCQGAPIYSCGFLYSNNVQIRYYDNLSP